MHGLSSSYIVHTNADIVILVLNSSLLILLYLTGHDITD